jgi:hypothetical protein
MKTVLTQEKLIEEAKAFAAAESYHDEPSLYGTTDGKAVGTYLEHKFTSYLLDQYSFIGGNSASGIDLPSLNTDIKVTSIKQPQSSCPFKSARQKIFGLGYNLIVFVYEKVDDHAKQTARLKMHHAIFVHEDVSADYQTTKGLLEIIDRDGNAEDLVAFMNDRNLPVDEIEANAIAETLLLKRPNQGYLTISNALQWRLQYGRAITSAGNVDGLIRIYGDTSAQIEE